MVFDGAPMPLKADVNQGRRELRERARVKGLEFQALGNFREAEKCFARAAPITSEMVNSLIGALKTHKIECIKSPYEADAQLAYLCRTGYVSAVISEDSDLLVFECPQVIYKLQADGGCKTLALDKLQKHFGWRTHDKFIMICIMSGCDYLKNCKNIGVKKAFKLTKDCHDIQSFLHKIKREIGILPQNYETNFYRAFYGFKHQKVYCPIGKKVIPLNDIEDLERLETNAKGIEFLGQECEDIDESTYQRVEKSDICLKRKMIFDVPKKRAKIEDYGVKVLAKSKYFCSQENIPPRSSSVSKPFKPPLLVKGLEQFTFKPINLNLK